MELVDPAVTRSRDPLPCPLCGETDAVVVGTRARFGQRVRNVACAQCGLVRITEEGGAPAAGEPATPGPVEGDRLAAWAEQAGRVLRLADPPARGRVLELGCGEGHRLAALAEMGGLEVVGVEPSLLAAARAAGHGLDVRCAPIDAPLEGEAPFDAVHVAHALVEQPDPVAALTVAARHLAPHGRLVARVPNLAHPTGALEGDFFRASRRVSFHADTLAACFRRAGLCVIEVCEGPELVVVGTPSARGPRPFDPGLLDHPCRGGAWIAERLDTYRLIARLRQELALDPRSGDHVTSLCTLLRRPSFPSPTAEAVREVRERLRFQGALRGLTALAVATAYREEPSGVRRVDPNAVTPPYGTRVPAVA